jgi:glycosyltransferase involved in cell wall biosynthesis
LGYLLKESVYFRGGILNFESIEVSIIIPTRHRPQLLTRLLGSLHRQIKCRFEVLVVDDSDPGKELSLPSTLNGFPLRYLRTSSRGANKARNLGIQHAKGDFVYLLDDDTFLGTAEHLYQLKQAFLQHDFPVLLGGRYQTPQDASLPQWIYNCSCNLWLEKGTRSPLPVLLGGNLAFRRQELSSEMIFCPEVFNGGDEIGFHKKFLSTHPQGSIKILDSLAVFHGTQLTWTALKDNSRRQQSNNPTSWKTVWTWMFNLSSSPWLAIPTLAYVLLGKLDRS